MLYREKIIQALENKGALFRESQQDSMDVFEILEDALKANIGYSKAELEAKLAGIEWPGACPTDEQDTQPFVVPFLESWQNHQQARAWAMNTLRGVATFCADGSQIFTRDISVPVGVVQIGWFENHHIDDGIGEYIKDVSIQVLAPGELSGDESAYADQEIEWRRFSGELAQAERFMRSQAGRQAVAFIDGSLIISFVSQLRPERQVNYVAAIENLLRISKETKVPVIGYVDTSYATDLVSMIKSSTQFSRPIHMSDAALVRQYFGQWGDRCRMYVCARDDRVLSPNNVKYYKDVHFTYLKTTYDNPPARLEIPAWVTESNQHDWVMDIIRAECVVGNGYPYTIETADAVAVLSAQDRERFLSIFQQFMEREEIPLRFSRKAVSKRQRRL